MIGSLQRGGDTLDSVVIGADPHKHSVTIEVVDDRERVLHKGRYGTDTDGYRQMLAAARRYPQRRWAVEGCNGIGRKGPASGRRRRDGR
jgi:transposase